MVWLLWVCLSTRYVIADKVILVDYLEW